MATADSKFAGHMYATPANIGFLVTVPGGAGCARQDRKSLFARGPTVLGNFDPSTPNLVH